MLQIFILAAVAIFLFWRLRAVLGSREGFEKNLKEIAEKIKLEGHPPQIKKGGLPCHVYCLPILLGLRKKSGTKVEICS